MSQPAAPLIVVTSSDPTRSSEIEMARQEVARYVDAVRRHGGDPVVVDPTVSEAEREVLFSEMAGLLLTGGSDIDPALYGEAIAGSGEVDCDRDQLELSAWEAAAASSVPVLGICRGLQAINVFAGGSLLQDLPDHAGMPDGSGPVQTHSIRIDPESLLARSLSASTPKGLSVTDDPNVSIELAVNSFHHQAVTRSRLAPGLRAVGWASSSRGLIIEAVESQNDRWIVGVQCHPELTDSTPDEFEGLFEAFIHAARDSVAKPSGWVGRTANGRGKGRRQVHPMP